MSPGSSRPRSGWEWGQPTGRTTARAPVPVVGRPVGSVNSGGTGPHRTPRQGLPPVLDPPPDPLLDSPLTALPPETCFGTERVRRQRLGDHPAGGTVGLRAPWRPPL